MSKLRLAFTPSCLREDRDQFHRTGGPGSRTQSHSDVARRTSTTLTETCIRLFMRPAPFEIPMRCLLPVLSRLIVTGRAISATRSVNGGARHMTTAMVLGQATERACINEREPHSVRHRARELTVPISPAPNRGTDPTAKHPML
jgi:hypothetical protein